MLAVLEVLEGLTQTNIVSSFSSRPKQKEVSILV